MSDTEGELIAGLRAMGGGEGENDFFISFAGQRFAVRYQPGSSSSVTLSARYDDVARADHEAVMGRATGTYRGAARGALVAIRPLAVTLRKESLGDVVAKAEAFNVEYQTGDDAFDREVYVNTPTTDERVLAAILGPAVRGGVLTLLALGFTSVTIDDRGAVDAYLSEFVRPQSEPDRAARAVAAFARVLSDLPRITASGAQHAEVPFWASAFNVGVIGVLGFGISCVGNCVTAASTNCTEGNDDGGTTLRAECGPPALVAMGAAIGLGVLGAALLRGLARPHLRGRSDAAERLDSLTGVAFLTFLAVTFFTLCAAGFVYIRS